MEADIEGRRMVAAYSFWAALYAGSAAVTYAVTMPTAGEDDALRLVEAMGGALVPLGVGAVIAAALRSRGARVRRCAALAGVVVVLGLMAAGSHA